MAGSECRDESNDLLAKMQSDKRAMEVGNALFCIPRMPPLWAVSAQLMYGTTLSLPKVTVSHYESKLKDSEAHRAEALAEATGSLEDEIARLIDERDDVLQRVRFLERQLAKLQAGMGTDIAIEHQATQTDASAFDDGGDEVHRALVALPLCA